MHKFLQLEARSTQLEAILNLGEVKAQMQAIFCISARAAIRPEGVL